jgi:hypothetical protein
MFEKRIVFSLPGMERIAPRANLVYKTDDGGALLADLYLAPASSTPAPIVIFIHGDIPEGFPIKPKDGGVFVSWGQLMAASGVAGVTFNHRMRWNNGFVPGSIAKAADDLRDPIAAVVSRARVGCGDAVGDASARSPRLLTWRMTTTPRA